MKNVASQRDMDWIDTVRQHQLQQLLQPSFNRHDNRYWFIYYLWSFGPRQYQSSLPNRILLVAAAAAFLQWLTDGHGKNLRFELLI